MKPLEKFHITKTPNCTINIEIDHGSGGKHVLTTLKIRKEVRDIKHKNIFCLDVSLLFFQFSL